MFYPYPYQPRGGGSNRREDAGISETSFPFRASAYVAAAHLGLIFNSECRYNMLRCPYRKKKEVLCFGVEIVFILLARKE